MPIRFDHRLAARERGGHLWVVAGLPARSARRLDRWFDSLGDLTLEQWAHVAREAAGTGGTKDLDTAVDAAILEHRLEVAAWFLRDAVATTLHYAFRASSRAPVVSRMELGRIQRVVELAALAIAAEPWLDRSVRNALIAPFVFILPSVFPRPLSRRRAIDRLLPQGQSPR